MITNRLARYLRMNAPILLWGPPGVGKTATIQAMARGLGWPLEVIIAAIREPTDFSGLPVVKGEEVELRAFGAIQRLAKLDEPAILFLDEISTAPPAVQAALLRLVLERVAGDTQLSRKIKIIAAANPPELAAGGWELSAPLANRFVHLQYRVDTQEWVQNFPSYWGCPPESDLDPDLWARARALVAGFIRSRPHLLLQVPQGSQQGLSWPSPRSWDAGSQALAACGLDLDDALEGVIGAVGEGVALEFYNWAKTADLPDPEEILANPTAFKVPERGDLLFVLLSGVVSAVVNRPTKARWEAVWQVMERVIAAPDIVAACAGPLVGLVRTKGYDLPRVFPRVAEVLQPILKGAKVI